jgi:hypothetical protein
MLDQMKRWLLVPILCVSFLASGCLTLGYAFTDPKETPRSQVIAGGVLGDVAIAGVASAVKDARSTGEVQSRDTFLMYAGVLLACDIVGAVIVWYSRKE